MKRNFPEVLFRNFLTRPVEWSHIDCATQPENTRYYRDYQSSQLYGRAQAKVYLLEDISFLPDIDDKDFVCLLNFRDE